ncbi:MAG TPA: ATP-binding protein [Salinimicrobium sp.]|nr:ATP-binding protein [Salinimicrobium sp.]
MVSRIISGTIINRLGDPKAIIIMGPRQVGKSTLLHQIKKYFNKPVLFWNGDEHDIRSLLSNATSTQLEALIGKAKTLVIDEAQRIDNIGLIIKLIVDQIKDVKVIATGSSAFDLSNKINEPLTGRKWEYSLYPLSYQEMVQEQGILQENRLLEQRLIYGYYPEIVTIKGNEIQRLKQLADSYLFKDILNWERILKPEKLERLLQALAFQVGNEVSYNELGITTGLDNQTIENYVRLLEKAFIIFRLPSFSRNLRNELKKSRKIYFYDNGIRNAVINQFNSLDLRNDIGALWENFLVSERTKFTSYQGMYSNKYFWRSHSQQEIDYIEEYNGQIFIYEFKWNENKKIKFPKKFIETYKPKESNVINRKNFNSFINF